jgi:hypothetical protein
MTFDEILEESDIAFDELGESATYKKASGTTRSITVIVDRAPNARLVDINRGEAPVRIFSVPNDTTRGISMSEWQPTDKLIVVDDFGASATTEFQLSNRPTASDGGRLHFKING